jgi:hypothetical protein
LALSEKCKGRIHNWKFERARDYLAESEPTNRERELVDALATVFGNSGWLFGEMATIVGAAVKELIGEEGDDDQEAGSDPLRQ